MSLSYCAFILSLNPWHVVSGSSLACTSPGTCSGESVSPSLRSRILRSPKRTRRPVLQKPESGPIPRPGDVGDGRFIKINQKWVRLVWFCKCTLKSNKWSSKFRVCLILKPNCQMLLNAPSANLSKSNNIGVLGGFFCCRKKDGCSTIPFTPLSPLGPGDICQLSQRDVLARHSLAQRAHEFTSNTDLRSCHN